MTSRAVAVLRARRVLLDPGLDLRHPEVDRGDIQAAGAQAVSRHTDQGSSEDERSYRILFKIRFSFLPLRFLEKQRAARVPQAGASSLQ